ncbi:MAG TPA: hypothetical protein VGO93_26000 [Candidatus Xenobia bacterium]
MKRLLVFLAVAGVAWSAISPAQERIQAEYDRAAQAMKYKYMDGVLAIRDHGYQCIGPDGKKVSPGEDMHSMNFVMAQSAAIQETTTILQFVQSNSNEARVRIRDTIVLGLPGPPDHPSPPYFIVAVNDDTWVRHGDAWKLSRTRIVKQAAGYGDSAPVLNQ